jgi:hypothetical protein
MMAKPFAFVILSEVGAHATANSKDLCIRKNRGEADLRAEPRDTGAWKCSHDPSFVAVKAKRQKT